jgi:polyferredoxin
MDNYGAQNGVPNGVPNGVQLEPPMRLVDWLIVLIVQAIPCVGLIMLFVWAFGEGNTNRKNYCRAMLIVMAAGLVIGLIFYATIAAAVLSALSSYSA